MSWMKMNILKIYKNYTRIRRISPIQAEIYTSKQLINWTQTVGVAVTDWRWRYISFRINSKTLCYGLSASMGKCKLKRLSNNISPSNCRWRRSWGDEFAWVGLGHIARRIMKNGKYALIVKCVYVRILILIVLGIYEGVENDWYVLFSIQHLIRTDASSKWA